MILFNINRFKVIIISVIITIFFIGCAQNELSEKGNGKSLYITKGFNENKEILFFHFKNGTINNVDTTFFYDKDLLMNFDNSLSFNRLFNKKIFSASGALYDLKQNKIISSDYSGEYQNDYGLFIKKEKDTLFFYNLNLNNICTFNLTNNKSAEYRRTKKFELQIFNLYPNACYISPSLNHTLNIEFPNNNESMFSGSLNRSANIKLKNIVDGSEQTIIQSIHGTTMSKYSSKVAVPSVIWINNSEFLFSDFKVKDTLTDCTIYKYNLLSKKVNFVGTIYSIPLSRSNATFEVDKSQNVYFFCRKDIYKIDYKINKISTVKNYDLGNNFSLSKNGAEYIFKFDNEEIIRIKSENFGLNQKYFKTIDGYLALSINEQIEEHKWVPKCKVWSKYSKKWIEIEVNEFTSIIDWENR